MIEFLIANWDWYVGIGVAVSVAFTLNDMQDPAATFISSFVWGILAGVLWPVGLAFSILYRK